MKLISGLRAFLLKLRLLFFKPKQQLIIVTGSDSSHFKSLQQLLYSLTVYEKNTKVLIYDLGLLQSEVKV
ncbi:hypothetical protein [Polaribacter sp. R77954]|uniref:hypothetical protein n=1 Tax=Polaribacter sp. R77954 TaxID=3093870 RepID=UPI0037CC5A7B